MHNFFRIQVNQAGFGPDDYEIIFRDEKSTRPQTIAVQCSTDKPSVGK